MEAVAAVKRAPFVRDVVATQNRFSSSEGGALSKAVAFQAFFSLFPLLLLGLSVIGFVLAGRPDLQETWRQAIEDAVPGIGTLVGENLDSAVDNRAVTGIIGLAGLAWTGLGLVRVSGDAVGRILGVRKYENFFKTQVWAISSGLALGAISLLSLGLGGVVGELGPSGISGVIVTGALTLATFAVDVALFLVAYRVLAQKPGPPWRELLPGAIFAAVGWTALKIGGTWYARRSVANAQAVYGTFAAAIGLLIILSVAARIFVYGAAFIARHKEPPLSRMKDAGRPLAAVTGEGRKDDMDANRSTTAQRDGKHDGRHDQRPTGQIVREIASDTSTLLRKEAELAKHEVVDAIVARARTLAGVAALGVLGLFAIGFGGSAAAAALDGPLPLWAARLIVAAGFLILGGIAFVALRPRAMPSFVPEETRRTVKEDIGWARQQLKR